MIPIWKLMVAVGLIAVFCGCVFAANTDATPWLFAGYLLTLLTRWRRYTLRWFPAVIALGVVAVTANDVEAISACIVAALGVLACAVAAIALGRKRRNAIVALASLLCIASVFFTLWPLKLTFAASRPEFEAMARKLDAGHEMTVPRKLGRFIIVKAEMRNGRPCLWTDTDPSGFSGFVRNPYGGVNMAKGLYPNDAFNLWSCIKLDGDWAFIDED